MSIKQLKITVVSKNTTMSYDYNERVLVFRAL